MTTRPGSGVGTRLPHRVANRPGCRRKAARPERRIFPPPPTPRTTPPAVEGHRIYVQIGPLKAGRHQATRITTPVGTLGFLTERRTGAISTSRPDPALDIASAEGPIAVSALASLEPVVDATPKNGSTVEPVGIAPYRLPGRVDHRRLATTQRVQVMAKDAGRGDQKPVLQRPIGSGGAPRKPIEQLPAR